MQEQRQLLFVQGGGPSTHDTWDNKLVESLERELGEAFEVRYPRMPHEDEPDYASWKAAIESELDGLRDGAIIVGHSVGGTILLKMLCEQLTPRALDALILIAPPFVGEGGWSTDGLQFPQDLGASLPADLPIQFYQGLDDQTVPPTHIDLYARAVPQARSERLPGRDHQLNNDMREVAGAILSLELAR